MTFTEEENRIIEAMARAACLATNGYPDADGWNHEGHPIKHWQCWEGDARRHYAMQKAMMASGAFVRRVPEKRLTAEDFKDP